MSEAEKMAVVVEQAQRALFYTSQEMSFLDQIGAAAALIRRLQAENEDFLEQIAVQTESVLFKELQEIMKANNALHDENARLKQLVDLADALRAAQRAYMADRGNDQLGRAVADAAKDYYALRSLWGPLMHRMVPQSAMGTHDAV
jgi:hypothetical protein